MVTTLGAFRPLFMQGYGNFPEGLGNFYDWYRQSIILMTLVQFWLATMLVSLYWWDLEEFQWPALFWPCYLFWLGVQETVSALEPSSLVQGHHWLKTHCQWLPLRCPLRCPGHWKVLFPRLLIFSGSLKAKRETRSQENSGWSRRVHA